MKSKTVQRVMVALLPVALTFIASVAFAQEGGGGGGGGDVSSMATTIKTQATAIASLLNITAYVAGVGFALAGILQFKAHKENPQQTPLSKPVVMIVVAACLLFLPTIMNIAGSSLFGSGGSQAISYTAPGK